MHLQSRRYTLWFMYDVSVNVVLQSSVSTHVTVIRCNQAQMSTGQFMLPSFVSQASWEFIQLSSDQFHPKREAQKNTKIVKSM